MFILVVLEFRRTQCTSFPIVTEKAHSLPPFLFVLHIVNFARFRHSPLPDELALTCAILRYQAIMGDVNEAHIEEYGSSLVDRIESEVGGKYKRLLVKMVENSI